MNCLNLNKILNREENALKIKECLNLFSQNKNNLNIKKGIYIYGSPGSGKTEFITKILKEMDYDIIKYDAGDFRNKSIIDTISKHNMSDKNIMNLFHGKIQKIAIIMDEIDGMNNGDKGGINTLIKLIRPKKTKKQKMEEVTMNPIICIGNYYIDKKIKELMKVCNTIELKTPTNEQVNNLISELIPILNADLKNNLINFVQGDLRKLINIYDIYNKDNNLLNNKFITDILQMKSYNDDTKQITKKLLNHQFNISEHIEIMNETDRTIVGLLWHENVIDVIGKMKPNISIPFYIKQLDNICFADYIDRITFQKQIWQFNEMSSLIKTFNNNNLYHTSFKKKIKYNPCEVRFTKVLTKYSTEYNNSIFIQNLCQQLGMDKKDIFAFFLNLKNKYTDNELLLLFENYEITKLDINRIYRYLEKYTKETINENNQDSDCDEESVEEV
jgi:DNA polymerase III delta prime subunit